MKKPAPAGVTVKTVLDNYIKSTKLVVKKLYAFAVKTVSMVGTATIPQAPAPLKFTMKKDAKRKIFSKSEMEGMGNYQNKWLMKRRIYSSTKA
ncbi:MAG: hypothetical protein U0T80_01055 [Flavobacteriaceae bacterium]